MTTETMKFQPRATGPSATMLWIGGAATVWVTAVITLAAIGVFDVPADQLALPTLLAIAVPVAAFAVVMLASPRLRAVALSVDPVLLTGLQAWRILGGLFLAVYAVGVLPGFFAWPAGLGDVAIGIAARNPIPGFVDDVTTAAMGQLPLVLIPTVAVPAFIILHLIALMQVRAKVRST